MPSPADRRKNHYINLSMLTDEFRRVVEEFNTQLEGKFYQGKKATAAQFFMEIWSDWKLIKALGLMDQLPRDKDGRLMVNRIDIKKPVKQDGKIHRNPGQAAR